jgi:hypothetical protein
VAPTNQLLRKLAFELAVVFAVVSIQGVPYGATKSRAEQRAVA